MNNKIKYVICTILLLLTLIIIKVLLQDTKIIGDLLPELFVLVVVSIIMILIPFIFKLVNKKKIKYKKGRIICLLNSSILFITFSIPNLLTVLKGNNNLEYTSMDPVAFSKSLIMAYLFIAIIYYFINMLLFVDNKE